MLPPPVAWRIAVDTPDYLADDVTGEGARRCGGRWNSPGRAAVYAAQHVSLACLETMARLCQGALPMNHYLVRLEIPEAAWSLRRIATLESLPLGWECIPPGGVSRRIGDAWLGEGSAPILVVPSVLIPEEQNVLLNPGHPALQQLRAVKVRRWHFDPRLLGVPLVA